MENLFSGNVKIQLQKMWDKSFFHVFVRSCTLTICIWTCLSAEFLVNFNLFFLYYAWRSHGYFCCLWKYAFWSFKNNFYFALNFFAKADKARQNMNESGFECCLDPIRAQTVLKDFSNWVKIISTIAPLHIWQKNLTWK